MPTSTTPSAPAPTRRDGAIPAEVFRAYDVRGIAPEPLSPELVHAVGWSIAREARELGETRVAIGRDGRLTGPEFRDALAAGLLAGGISVVDMGQVPTPILYFASREIGSGVMITGSHNPPNYNGLKISLAGETLFGPRIQKLRERLEVHGWPGNPLPDGGAGSESGDGRSTGATADRRGSSLTSRDPREGLPAGRHRPNRPRSPPSGRGRRGQWNRRADRAAAPSRPRP